MACSTSALRLRPIDQVLVGLEVGERDAYRPSRPVEAAAVEKYRAVSARELDHDVQRCVVRLGVSNEVFADHACGPRRASRDRRSSRRAAGHPASRYVEAFEQLLQCGRARCSGSERCTSRLSSSSVNSENNVICTCCGRERPAVWLSATSRLSATIRSMNGERLGLVRDRPVALGAAPACPSPSAARSSGRARCPRGSRPGRAAARAPEELRVGVGEDACCEAGRLRASGSPR